VLEKIKAAKDVGDDDLRNKLLEEGKQLLIERNNTFASQKNTTGIPKDA